METRYNRALYYVLRCASHQSISTRRLDSLEIDTVKASGVFNRFSCTQRWRWGTPD